MQNTIILLLLAGCIIFDPPSETQSQGDPTTVSPVLNAVSPYPGDPIQPVTFGQDTDTKQINLADLKNHSVFLIKVNRSSRSVNYTATGHGYTSDKTVHTQGVTTIPPARFGSPRAAALMGKIPLYDHPEAYEFNRNPPPFSPVQNTSRNAREADVLLSASVGSIKEFWVQNRTGVWQQINAGLRGVSTYAHVWIAEDNFDNWSWRDDDNKLTQLQAQKIADKFDRIYTYETALFGYEYGGGVPSTDPTYGGVDGEPKIQILVYDIEFDYNDTSKDSMILGYFWAKDFYDQSIAGRYGLKTNKAELFYIDSYMADKAPDLTYSTLVHEFQHMINFNEKKIKHDLNSATWYNEMLSMLAEDVITPLIDISADFNPIKERIPIFLKAYNQTGVTEWNESNILVSYSNVYAFGAYLARNYGGAALVSELSKHTLVDIPSLSSALSKYDSTFDKALRRYGEAFIYPDTGGTVSFAKTITKTINNVDYTFKGFDIWNLDPPQENQGPVIWSLDWKFTMPAYSLVVQSLDTWQDITGDITITVQKPADPNIEMYIMIR